jgi:hypothetical protein
VVHDPTLEGTTTLGFCTVIELEVAVTTVIGVVAVLQGRPRMWLQGKLGARRRRGRVRRTASRSHCPVLVIAYHGLWAVGLETGRFHDGTNLPMRTVAHCLLAAQSSALLSSRWPRSDPSEPRLVPACGR